MHTKSNFPYSYIVDLGQPMRGATWIYLSWESSESEESLSYAIMWERDTMVGCPGEEKNNIPNTSDSFNITDLQEDSRYRIVVSAMNIDGHSNSITVTATTLEAGERNLMLNAYLYNVLLSVVSSAAPTGLNVSAVTQVSITIHWELLPCQDQNGDITGHSVRYGEVDSDTSQTVSVPGGENNQTVISGLVPSTEYWIQVAAVNSAGTGDYSTPIVQETDGEFADEGKYTGRYSM